MKRHWLRGMLLGVSMAVLLASGVALAQGMSVTVDQYCVECCTADQCTGLPSEPEWIVPPDQYKVDLDFSQLDTQSYLCLRGTLGSAVTTVEIAGLPASECDLAFWFPCDGLMGLGGSCAQMPGFAVRQVRSQQSLPLGDWQWSVWQESGGCSDQPPGDAVQFTISLAEECPTATLVLGELVWHDTDHDGLQDPGEPGVAGVTVNLYDCQGHFQSTTTTDENGRYSFGRLMPGDFYLEFLLPEGHVFTRQDQGVDDAVDSDVDPATGRTACLTLTAEESGLIWAAGLHEAPAAFVPEPGSVLLLGSGLAGLAGYGALRWRTRK